MRARLINKRKRGRSGAYNVTAICEGCEESQTAPWAGWTTIVCKGCGETLKRGEYRNNADVRMDGLEERIRVLEHWSDYVIRVLEDHQLE